MTRLVCESCGNVFETVITSKIFNPDCPKCGSCETSETNKVVKELSEYEVSQE